MEYSNPKDILFEDSRIDKLKNIAKDPYVVSNFFSKDEIDYINEQKDKGEKVSKFGKVVNWKYNKNNQFRDWLEEKFKETLELDFTMHGGNFFQTNVPFYVHTDTSKNEEPGMIPYKNIVVPLTQSTEQHRCFTVVFKQRWFGEATMFWKGPVFLTAKSNYNHKVEDYTMLENYTGEDISTRDYMRFLTHLPHNNLHGLSIHSVYEWNVGDIIVFYCTQLHSSNDFTATGTLTPKFALSYFCRLKDA